MGVCANRTREGLLCSAKRVCGSAGSLGTPCASECRCEDRRSTRIACDLRVRHAVLGSTGTHDIKSGEVYSHKSVAGWGQGVDAHGAVYCPGKHVFDHVAIDNKYQFPAAKCENLQKIKSEEGK